MNLVLSNNKKREILLYITIFSIFLTDIKLYIPLFALNITYVIFLILKKQVVIKLNKWSKSLIVFIGWFLVNTIIAVLILKSQVNYATSIKLFLNLNYLLSIYLLMENKLIAIDRKSLVQFLKIIILINFIQILTIYIKGGLFSDFISGNLTKNSDAAYVVSYYNNVIGGTNKNIWASKFIFMFIAYLFICVDNTFSGIQNKIEKIIFISIGSITTMLLLSRTSQLALIVPIIFLVFYSIRNIDKKYKVAIYSISIIGVILGIVIFFEKIFHIKFDMTDGGYTRIIIWIKCLKEVFTNNLFIGSGVGTSGYFIQNVIGRFESNTHNVFITTLYELGVVGLSVYCIFIYNFVKEYINKKDIFKYVFIFIIPIFMIINLQYLGYDNDLVAVMILMMIISNIKKREVYKYE